MLTNEDYSSLIQGICNLNFTSDSIPCKLLVTGDTAFPVLVTPTSQVLIAASRYGKGRLVVMSHESYLNEPQFMDFLQNAISWLKPSSEAVIGVVDSLGLLENTLSKFGHHTEIGFRKDLGVFCMNGYDDNQASEIASFLREGGGLLIGAQAWQWSESHPELNVFYEFPGNKITSITGVYFTNKKGENGSFSVNKNPPPYPSYDELDFSVDLKQLLNGISTLNISGDFTASELLLHGPLTFPIGVTDSYQCFFAAAYYGRGRILVGTHEQFLLRQELKPFILNAILWLDAGRNGRIGVHKNLNKLISMVQDKGISCASSNVSSEFSVYCCPAYNEAEIEQIQQFVAEGGGLLISGHSWYWSYSNPNVLTQFPGNKILNKFGISILKTTIKNGDYKVSVPKSVNNTYHFLRAICQFLRNLKNNEEVGIPLSSWLSKLRQDVLSFLKLPAYPLTVSLWQEISSLTQGCYLPKVSKQHPVKSSSKEAFILCLAQEVSCLYESDEKKTGELDVQEKPTAMVQIDATNPGGDAWRSTGLYLPPNKKAILLFPASVVEKGLQVQVGCQSDDLNSAKQLCRAPVVVHRKNVSGEKVVISCVWGGLLYVIVKGKSQLGIVPVTVYGAEPAPTFIKGQTTLSMWLDTIRSLPAPWAELITDNIILTVPSEAIRSLEDPELVLSLWDEVMLAITDLASVSKKLPRPERFVTDVQISAGWMHAGYPVMCHMETAASLVSLTEMKKGMWGPVHELGHNQQRGPWEFPPHTTEATCNLWSVYVHETVLGITRDKAHHDLTPEVRENRVKQYVRNGAKLKEWRVWTALETYLQLQEGFGWDPFKQVFLEYQTMSNVSNNMNDKMNLWAEKFSQLVNKNLAPFFQAWGWPIDEETSTKLSILAAWEENPMKNHV